MARQSYHHGDLRNALVEAAIEIVGERGPDGLSVADAARRAGVSGAAPYRHFASRDDLLSAAAAALATHLIFELQDVTAAIDIDDPVASAIDTLVALNCRRFAFTVERGLDHELVFAHELRIIDDPVRRDVTRQLFDMFLWPALTITGDARAAGQLLRQTAAVVNGYAGFARSSGRPAPAESLGLVAEVGEAVRLLSEGAAVQSQPLHETSDTEA